MAFHNNFKSKTQHLFNSMFMLCFIPLLTKSSKKQSIRSFGDRKNQYQYKQCLISADFVLVLCGTASLQKVYCIDKTANKTPKPLHSEDNNVTNIV